MAQLRAVFSELVRLEIELWNAVESRLQSDFGLPLTHFEPMSVIDRHGTCRVYDIASELVLTTGGTSKLVDRIEANGYCRRLPNPADRRSSLLELTSEGRRLLRAATVAVDDELEHRLGSTVSRRTMQQFLATLTHLRTAGHEADVGDRSA